MKYWELITEVKDSGYYIGWQRLHPKIHMPEPMQPMSKMSLVQIGGNEGAYQVRGLTYAHSILEAHLHKTGLKLFDKAIICNTLFEARNKATEFKRMIAKSFDTVTRSDINGNLILRGGSL